MALLLACKAAANELATPPPVLFAGGECSSPPPLTLDVLSLLLLLLFKDLIGRFAGGTGGPPFPFSVVVLLFMIAAARP